ncbi:unnamed protein product [Trichobilharzia szidati]|nr:unnamed protein product [Trichobilharzia szidati]
MTGYTKYILINGIKTNGLNANSLRILLNAENRTVLFSFILKRNSRIIIQKDANSDISRILKRTSNRYHTAGVHCDCRHNNSYT